jgi:hypothetical protein
MSTFSEAPAGNAAKGTRARVESTARDRASPRATRVDVETAMGVTSNTMTAAGDALDDARRDDDARAIERLTNARSTRVLSSTRRREDF